MAQHCRCLFRLFIHWLLMGGLGDLLGISGRSKPLCMLRFLSNHDMDRISFKLGNSLEKTKHAYEEMYHNVYLARFWLWSLDRKLENFGSLKTWKTGVFHLLQFIFLTVEKYVLPPQHVVVYYGDEVGMLQTRSCSDRPIHGDLACRQVSCTLRCSLISYPNFSQVFRGFDSNSPMLSHIKRLNKWTERTRSL